MEEIITRTPNFPNPRDYSQNGHHGQTGPISPAGKERSRANAVKHGIEASDEVFFNSLTPEENSSFRKVRRALRKFYDPETTFEKLIVDRMAIHHVRMLRLYKLEYEAIAIMPLDKGNQLSILPHLDRLSRYDVRVEKQLRILHNRLISLYDQRLSNVLKLLPTKE